VLFPLVSCNPARAHADELAAPLNLSVLPKHDLEPSPRLQTPQLTASPADTPMMSQLTTPTIGYHTAPRTPLAVVPEAQAKRNWFEKTFSGRPLGVGPLPGCREWLLIGVSITS